MTIFYQHVGYELWKRDTPRSVGVAPMKLVQFQYSDIEAFLAPIDLAEKQSALRNVEKMCPAGFQIWGLPDGASHVLAKMKTSDVLLLLDREDFRYSGKVVHYFSRPLWDLSRHLWLEQKSPRIVLLMDTLTRYPWSRFVEDFGFSPSYHLRGQTMRLADEKMRTSRFQSDGSFLEYVTGEFCER